jgi:hypothetical protein
VGRYLRRKGAARGKRASSKKKVSAPKPKPVKTPARKPAKKAPEKLTRAERLTRERRSEAAKKAWRVKKAEERRQARLAKLRAEKAAKTRARRKKKAAPSAKRQTKKALLKQLRKVEKKLEVLESKKAKKKLTKKELAAKKADLESEQAKARADVAIHDATRPKVHPSPDEMLRIQQEADERLRRDLGRIVEDAEKRGDIPTPPLGDIEERDGPKTTSSRVHVPIATELDASEIDSIVGTVRKFAQQLEARSGWYGTIALSAVGRRVVGSGGWKMNKTDDLAERGVQAEGYSSTGAHGTLEGMLARLWVALEELASEGASIFVRYVTVTTFDRKTPDEQAEWKEEHGA